MAKKKANKKQALVPELRFPEFRGPWANEFMGDLYSFIPTNSFSRDKMNEGSGEVRNIHYGDIHTKLPALLDLNRTELPRINRSEPLTKFTERNYCRKSDMIFADASEDLEDIGKCIEVVDTCDLRVLAGLHTIHARQKTDRFIVGFAGHLFHAKAIRTQIQRESQGAKVLGISATRISAISVYFPEQKAEQQKIADCLGSLDDLIGAHSAKLDALQANRNGFLQQLFPADGETVPVLRFPGFEEDWEAFEVDEILKSVSTRGYQIPNSAINKGGKHPVVDQAKEPVAGYSDQSSRLFKKTPIIVFGDHTTVIKFVDFEFVVGADGTKLLQKRRKSDCLRYLSYALERYKMAQDGYKRHFSILRKIRIGVPTPQEQERIADYLTTLDAIIASQTEQIFALKDHKSGLMQQLFPDPDSFEV